MPAITEVDAYQFRLENLPRGEAVFIRVENFEVQIKREDEGIVVDIFDDADEDERISLGSTYALDTKTKAYQEG